MVDSFSIQHIQVVKDMAKQSKHCEASIARVYSASGEPILLYATYTPLFFPITYTAIFARIRAKFHTYTSRKSTYNIPTYNYLVIAYIQRIVVAYSCNVYMSKINVLLQRICAVKARIRALQR